jgi:hypothetical protein
MVNNKPIISSGEESGFNFISGNSPNNDRYSFYKSQVNPGPIYLYPIVLDVKDNFGILSICSSNGYNGGKNLLSYK